MLQALAAFGAVAVAPGALAQRDPAQEYPGKPIRLLCPFSSAAGGVDTTARAIAQKLTEACGSSRWWWKTIRAPTAPSPSTCQALAPLTAIRLPYDFLQPFWFNVTLQAISPYDLTRDLALIAQCTSQPYVLVVNPQLPVKNVAELIALAKAKPTASTMASGIGRLQPIFPARLFASRWRAPADGRTYPTSGGKLLLADVVDDQRGNIQMLFSTLLCS